MAAELAYRFVVIHGLRMQLSDAGITPDLENSINQLQELYQKKYVEQTVYEFEEHTATGLDQWYCTCRCFGIEGYVGYLNILKSSERPDFEIAIRQWVFRERTWTNIQELYWSNTALQIGKGSLQD